MTDMVLSKIAGSSSFLSMLGTGYFAITDAVAISIVTSASAVVMAGISAYFAYRAKVIAETTGKAVDGHLTEFKQMARTSFTAEGVLLEKADEKARQAAHAEGVLKERERRQGTDDIPEVPIIKEAVKQAVVESVKEPAKEAVLETGFTEEHIEAIIAALRAKKK